MFFNGGRKNRFKCALRITEKAQGSDFFCVNWRTIFQTLENRCLIILCELPKRGLRQIIDLVSVVRFDGKKSFLKVQCGNGKTAC